MGELELDPPTPPKKKKNILCLFQRKSPFETHLKNVILFLFGGILFLLVIYFLFPSKA